MESDTFFHSPGHKSRTRFCFESARHSAFLSSRGFTSFSDFWELPHHFVDAVNYRRGGWSGVTKLCLKDGASGRNYYVKRQVNQYRYSLGKPMGALTFEYEVAAIKQNRELSLPAIELAAWGTKKAANKAMGLLVTPETDWLTLDDIIASKPEWSTLDVLLSNCGEQLLEMHNHGIQHGALYAKHIFINPLNGDIKLIDFERGRNKFFAKTAIRGDLRQLLKYIRAMPEFAIEKLLRPYQKEHGRLIADLVSSQQKKAFH